MKLEHTTKWISQYRNLLEDLERVRVALLGPDPFKQAAKMKDVFAPILDNPASADWDSVAEAWWNQEGDAEIEAAKKEVAIQRQLGPLYERLKTATSEEWEAYAKLVCQSRFVVDSSLIRVLLQGPGIQPATG
jgi:hypothetical protein